VRSSKLKKIPLSYFVLAALPGANCGTCGYPGCEGYAKAIVEKGDKADKCSPGRASGVEEK